MSDHTATTGTTAIGSNDARGRVTTGLWATGPAAAFTATDAWPKPTVVGGWSRARVAATALLAAALALAVMQPAAAAMTLHYPAGLSAKKSSKASSVLTSLRREFLEHRSRVATGEALGPFKSASPLVRVAGDDVVIDAVASGDTSNLAAELEALGATSVSIFGAFVSAHLPITAIDSLDRLPSLRFARPASAITRVGSVTSQGDPAMRADVARMVHGVDGSGVTVGVMSDSFDCMSGEAADIASGDLPVAGVAVLKEDVGCSSGSDEGRAMLQLVHDVAPGAALMFRTAFDGTADFAAGIGELVSAGATVLVDDVGYLAQPFFQDGIVAQAADAAAAMGVPYFSSAGNSGNLSYESAFRSSTTLGPSNGPLHDFDPGPSQMIFQTITIPVGRSITLSLQWDEPFFSVSGAPGAQTDVDVYITDATGSVIAAGVDDNIMTGDPVELAGFTNDGSIDVDGIPGADTTFFVAMELYAGTPPTFMKYVLFGSGISIDTFDTASSTCFGHPNAANTIGVGAAAYFDTPAFGQSPPLLESFSSIGGTPILFDVDGNPTFELRNKPEVVAPDGTDTTFFGFDFEPDGFPNFFGTSAASPHAGGVAALLLSSMPNLTPEQVYAALQRSTIDMDAPGLDFNTGFGLVQADAAFDELPTGETCDIDFDLTNAVTLGALRFEVDYSGAPGGFQGSGAGIPSGGTLACSSPLQGTDAAFSDNDDGLLTAGFISNGGFTGPTTLATCVFEVIGPSQLTTGGGATTFAAPVAGDFAITVTDASTPQLDPAQATVVVGDISCAGSLPCGQPISTGSKPTASDCLFILKSAVGSATCSPACVCDTDGGGTVSATDALTCLKVAVGQTGVTLNCPC